MKAFTETEKLVDYFFFKCNLDWSAVLPDPTTDKKKWDLIFSTSLLPDKRRWP